MEINIKSRQVNGSDEAGTFLTGNIQLVDDKDLFRHKIRYHNGEKITLNLIMLNQLTPAEIMRLTRQDVMIEANICLNLFDPDVIPKRSVKAVGKLTKKQNLVLSKVATGKRINQIAAELNVHPDTIKSHLYNAYNIIDLHDKVLASLSYMIYKASNG